MFQPVPVRPAPPCPQPPVSRPTPPEDAPAPDGLPAPDALPPEARRALADLLGEGRVVAHRPCFARLFGGAACGLLLSQFWFWTGTPTVGARASGWFWKSQREITEETGLSRAETETARRRLCALGVLEEERRGIPSTLHFRLNQPAVLRRLWAHFQTISDPSAASSPQTGSRGTRTLVRGIPASQSAGIAQTTSEIISEKTREKTQTRARPLLPAAFAGRDPERSARSGPVRGMSLFRELRVTEAAVRGAVVRGAAISTTQHAVNQGGVARLKAALAAASRVAAPRVATRPEAAPGRAPPVVGRWGAVRGGQGFSPGPEGPVYTDGPPLRGL